MGCVTASDLSSVGTDPSGPPDREWVKDGPRCCATSYNTYVFSGGAVKAAAFVGCVRYLEHVGLLSDTCGTTFVGTSAGALVAFMLCLGLSSDDMERLIRDEFERCGAHCLDPDGILEMYDNMGVDGGEKMESFLRSVLRSATTTAAASTEEARDGIPPPDSADDGKSKKDGNPGGLEGGLRDISFVDLAKRTGRNLVVCAANLTRAAPEYFSVDTWPDLSVITALRASTCIPIVYVPVCINDMMFVDGGVFENLPLGALDPKHDDNNRTSPTSRPPPPPHSSGVLVMNTGQWPLIDLPRNIFQFAEYIINAMLRRSDRVSGNLHARGEMSGWTVVDISAKAHDSSDDDNNDNGVDASVSAGDCLGDGFNVDRLVFNTFNTDPCILRRYVDRGYRAMRDSGCFDASRVGTNEAPPLNKVAT